MVCLGRPYRVKLFKGCLSQILLGPILNTLLYVLGLETSQPNMLEHKLMFRANNKANWFIC